MTIKNLDDLKKLINCFYTKPVADLIEKSAQETGKVIANELLKWLDFGVLAEAKKPQMKNIENIKVGKKVSGKKQK